ncbi:alpha/beta hydrolase [uncultured Tenacibaculum sp.]|uniref:alpha/beta fold hydrolase n=1 Tax=uncultured Tenacibaculum sp. TaxID=174713 RepID=UPI00263A15A8|nr:alpha/beta hydrolase [uncultured Tenacibaculum sp.]
MRVLFSIILFVVTISNGFAQQKETQIGYHSFGNGNEKVMVLHDWNGDHSNWNQMSEYLNPKEFTYVFMDARGQGLSLGIKGEYTVTEIAKDLLNLADTLGWKSFSIVGHSFSTLSAQIATKLNTNNRIKSIILVSGGPASGLKFSKDEVNFFNAVAASREVAEQAIGALTSNRYTKLWNEKKAQEFLEAADVEVSRAYLKSFANVDYSKGLIGNKTPTLVVTTEFDYPSLRLENIKPRFEAMKYKDIKYVNVGNSGHYSMQETPVFLATTIENFILNVK